MPDSYQVVVHVPVNSLEAAGAVRQRLQEASTAQSGSGAWVARGGPSDAVRVRFTLDAESADAARERALAWTRAELARPGVAIPGVGEPTTVDTPA
ncbi:MAG TPA: hypothetical protein VM490_08970 [Armatimonadaceae bacterium]|nr:hypothetical protein [Armatimonadaceae bacterium]